MEGEESLQRAENLEEHNLRAISDTREALSSLGRREPIWRVCKLGVQGTCSGVSVGVGRGRTGNDLDKTR